MVESDTFAARLRDYKNKERISLERIGVMAGGVSPQAVHKWLKGGEIEDENLLALARASGLPASWWRYGDEGQPRLPKAVASKRARYDVTRIDGTIDIPRFEVKASMGDGAMRPGHDPFIGSLKVSEEWVRRNLPAISSPDNLGIIIGLGDSMEPSYYDGDILLVDRGVREVRIDAVYVFTIDDELYVKTLQRLPGGSIKVISDNRKYDPYLLDLAGRRRVDVLGRIVWGWNGHKM